MAFPSVLSVTKYQTSSTKGSHPVNYPAVTADGDLLVMLFAQFRFDPITTPSGWSLLGTNGITNYVRLTAFVRRADGTEGGGTVTVQFVGAERAVAQMYRITGWRDSGTILNDVEAAVVSQGPTASPNPPNLDPANWGVEDTLWLATCGVGMVGVCAVSSYPTSYTNGETNASGDGFGHVLVGSARRELAAASEDPGTFTLSTSERVVAMTIAVRPGEGVVQRREPVYSIPRAVARAAHW